MIGKFVEAYCFECPEGFVVGGLPRKRG